ncbi:MAG: 50S ribosomal protein L29 [Verrucomicrobia bacterium]|jgi:large subunit ribosomal protein L29|nr:MAG: 50S ribosomal protein L29 [Verrucomicrobiota bacterium]|tara:strand:- start:406 stop:837 length:432 start_codon:yes stop_codon:yes gene_type:complete
MNISEIRDKTKVELAAQGRDLRMELFNLKLQKASSQLEKPVRLRELRRDIARIETQVTQLGRKDALGNLAAALEGVKDFTVDGVAGALRGLAKGELSRKDVLKVCGSVFNKQRVRLTVREMAELIQAKGREKAVELVKKAPVN